MRRARVSAWAGMLLLFTAFAHAQSLFPTGSPQPSSSQDVDFQFHDVLRVAVQTNETDSKVAPEFAPGSTQSEASTASDSAPPQCQCVDCQTPEASHACETCPRVNNVNPAWGVTLGGTISLDAFFNSARPVAPGTPFFLTPKGPNADDTFDIHARETTLYAAASGPKIGDWETGGLLMFALYNDSITVDRYGILPFQAFGELKNEDWRVAGGLQLDIFAPVIPNVLPFSILAATGNAGMYRGQFRIERFWHPAKNEQITLTMGVSDANPTYLQNDTLIEDNGWPNVEMRAAWAAGPLKREGLAAQRPVEIGVSTFVGQIRSTQLGPLTQVVDDTFGLAGDFRWRINDCWGFQGEVFTGQGLGTYGGGILQTTNSTTFEAIRASGGWLEIYHYCTPCVHTHWGYGIDDPVNNDVSVTQADRNETAFANVIWDVTQSFRLATEFTYRTTDWLALPDNQGFGLQWQMQWKF